MTEPREAEIVSLRRSRPKGPVELFIKDSEEIRVYTLRLGQLATLAVDGTKFACAHINESPWQSMWERRFDHPELLSDS